MLANSSKRYHNTRMNNKENIYDYDYANEIREMLLEEMFSLQEIKLDLSIN